MSDGGELVSFVLAARCDDQIVDAQVDDDGDLTLDYDLEEDIALEEMGYPASDCLSLVREFEDEPVKALLSNEALLIPEADRVLLAIGIADHAIERFGRYHGKDYFSDSPEKRLALRDIIMMSGNITRASQAYRLLERARGEVKLAEHRKDVSEADKAFRIAYSDELIATAVREAMKALHAHLYGHTQLAGPAPVLVRKFSQDTASYTRQSATQQGMAERDQKAYGNEYQWQLDYILDYFSDQEDEE